MSDTYIAVMQLRPGRYAGEVRDIHKGRVALCPHSHKRRSTAMQCARRMHETYHVAAVEQTERCTA